LSPELPFGDIQPENEIAIAGPVVRHVARCLEDSVHPAPLLPSAGVEHPATERSSDRDPPQERVSAWTSKEDLDRRLDRALEETFPASDPVSIVCN
jgi:hypothetical protein